MADSSLQDRLRDHAKAFDGLLSLIPAKMYYGEDTSDQWKKEKQTKQEAAAARRAKLDPDSALNRNAKEIMDERAKNKRKLREMEQDDNEPEEAYEPIAGVETEKPLEGLKRKNPDMPQKKAKTNGDVEAEEGNGEAEDEARDVEATPKLSRKEEKRAAKREKKAEKKAEKKMKQESGEAAAAAATPAKTPAKTPVKGATETTTTTSTPASKKQKNKKAAKEAATPSKPQPTPSKSQNVDVKASDKAEDEIMQDQQDGLDPSLDFSGLQREDDGSAVSAPDSELHSPTFDSTETPNGTQPTSTEPASTTTSISEVAPSEKPKHLKIPADTTALRARLAAKIEALRAARKADGTNGKPIRTRQELIEARRAKEAQRKAHKKELRQLAKEEAQKKREEALASNSPGVMSPNVSLDDAAAQGSFAFGRVAFADGTQMSHDLGYFLNRGKKKGPSDPKTALLKVQHEKKRIEELDAEKRQDIEEKETWLNARRRAEGEKIRDDEALLKKAVKRKEAAKKKSEKAWKERATGVAQAQREKQKKREENIKQRREDKLLRRSGKKKKGGASKKKGGRPGFEGSFGVGGKRK
ncbi:SURF6-domain-containing protein [Trichoderma citrinoviride]|uniref:SURF6-domain-containing protein n=1 Tax=Trichoderma citrinoviride TaxID=58853 RepID=A0A2T4AZM3_9HYPO|nr:SURF6-domain-containing protein [Trichoderma citrinoviride]PTB62438.1 SURF6-domain-containing protein [Trichoderma citrinoviride]